jgi:hypothetical protein
MSEQQAEQQKFDVVFSGSIADGFVLAAVKEKAAQIFKMDDQKIAGLFQNKPLALKKNIDENAANKYQKVLTQIGMVVSVVPHEAALNTSSPSAVVGRQSSHPSSVSSGHKEKTLTKNDTSRSQAFDSSKHWTLEEVGARLTDASSVNVTQPQDITVPDYTLRSQPCNILASEEMLPTASAPVLPDLARITMRDVGEDLLSDSEKPVIVAVDVRVNDLSMREVGSELLSDDEKQVFVEKPVNTSRIQLIE